MPFNHEMQILVELVVLTHPNRTLTSSDVVGALELKIGCRVVLYGILFEYHPVTE